MRELLAGPVPGRGRQGELRCLRARCVVDHSLCEARRRAGVGSNGLCLRTPAGRYTDAVGTTECTQCPEGRAQGASGQPVCSNCSAGEFQDEVGSASCKACESGKFSGEEESVECLACPAGSAQGASGQTACVDCLEGFFAREAGLDSCLPCSSEELGSWSAPGASRCALCTPGFYRSNDTGACERCPSDASCAGDLFLPAPSEGFWVDRQATSYAGSVYRCVRKTVAPPPLPLLHPCCLCPGLCLGRLLGDGQGGGRGAGDGLCLPLPCMADRCAATVACVAPPPMAVHRHGCGGSVPQAEQCQQRVLRLGCAAVLGRRHGVPLRVRPRPARCMAAAATAGALTGRNFAGPAKKGTRSA